MTPQTPTETGQSVLLTEKDAAKILGFSARTLQAWRWRGGGPQFVRVSHGCVRYRREDLSAWVEERLCRSTADEGPGTEAQATTRAGG